jgi:hypothetical protein
MMPKQTVPVKIKPHLIPFFYKEFKAAADADYFKIKAKACKITIDSSIGKLFTAILQSEIKAENFYIYFSVPEKINEKPAAHIYQINKNKNELIKVTPKLAIDLNYLFEDLFRFAFVNTVFIAKKYAPHLQYQNIILDFMKEYNLEEYGFRLDSMRKLYNREIKESNSLKRFQTKSANRVLNFSS